jgi:hypothetical protein
MATAQTSPANPPEPLASLPLVGDTMLEDALFYAAVGAIATFGWVQWPTAALFASAHALHQRARNVSRTGKVEEAREAMIEVADEVL